MNDSLQRLAQINNHPHPITSLYLALDQPRDARLQTLGQMIKQKEQQMAGNGSGAAWKQIAGDMEKITRYVEELPMGPHRGLALFCCQTSGLFEPHPLSLKTPNMLEVGPAPYIRPLAALSGDHRPTLVVVLDTRRARFFQGLLGALEENEQLALENAPAAPERDGDRGRAGNARLGRKTDEAASRHYKEAAAKIMELFKDHSFQELILGGSKSALESFQSQLHPYLAERLVGVFSCDINSPQAKIAAEVGVLQPQARRQRQEKMLANLADNLGPGGQAATGLNQVLAALHEGKVHTLFMRRGYTAAGGACPGCSRLRHLAGDCPICGLEMTPVDDVISLALNQAIEYGAALEQIDGESPLDDLESIAALLRYV